MIQPSGLATQIVEELGRSIIRGDLNPTDVLPTEQELCVRFGVSRTIVREAMKALSAKGLLESRPKRGARVLERIRWSPLDVDVLRWMEKDERFYLELIELRRIVELPAAELATLRATEQNLLAMDEALAEMVQAETENRPHQFREADMKLHQEIARACQNQLVEQLLYILAPFIGVGLDATLHLLGVVRTGDLHRNLVDGIRRRDPEGARTAMSGIIDQAWANLHLPKETAANRVHHPHREGII